MNRITTNYAVAPGEYLEEWLEDQEMTQLQCADRLGCSRKLVNEIVNGRATVTSDTALRLERVTRIPASSWLRYEAAYRADLSRIADEANLAAYADCLDPQAAKYLRKIDATSATMRDPGQLVSDFLTFHRCGTWDAYVHMHEEAGRGDYALAALTESKANIHPTLLTLWLRAGELDEAFERGRGFVYDPDDLTALLPELRARTAHPDNHMLRELAGMLANVGVVFVVVTSPERFPLYGITRWIDKRVPVIQQTGRRKKDGFVTWALFHELGHVLNDPRGEMHLEFADEKKRNSSAEKGANEFALKTLFGANGLEPFRGLQNDREIRDAARQVGVSPGVVVHQLHRKRLLDYSYGNRLAVDLDGTFV